MKILVTGANGLLGQQLVRKLVNKGYDVIATGRGRSRSTGTGNKTSYIDLDITKGEDVNKLITSQKPEVIIHAAAMTQVDECEQNKVVCWNTNVTATRFIVDAAREIKSRIILISTDFVFDGVNGPYSEEDEPNPINYYGSTKLGAENAVMESGLSWAIVRTVLVLGKTSLNQRQNIVTWVKEKLEKGETIKVVNDQVRTPTFVGDLADGILLVLEKNAGGIFHIAGKDTLTPYQIAIETATYLRLDKNLIEEVDVSSFQQTAVRPARTGFVITKATSQLNYQPREFSEVLQGIFGED